MTVVGNVPLGRTGGAAISLSRRDVMGRTWSLKGLLNRHPESLAPQEFVVGCDCGTLLQGLRKARWQRIRCPRCWEYLAVLPANPRPQPAEPSKSGRKALARRQRKSDTADAGRELVRVETDAEAPLHAAAGQVANASTPAPTTAAPTTAAPTTAAPTTAAPTTAARRASTPNSESARLSAFLTLRQQLAKPAKRIAAALTVARLATATVVVLALLTALWTLRSWQRARDTRELDARLSAGREALRAGDFPSAARELRVAEGAAQRLGDDNESARSARHLRRESDAWSRLALPALEAWLRRSVHPVDPARARQDFHEQFAGRTLILDGWLKCSASVSIRDARPESEQARPEAIADFEWQMAVEEASVKLEIDAAAVAHWVDSGEPQRVVFAGRVADVAADSSPGAWRIRLEPGSYTLLTEEGPLERSGMSIDDELRSVLARQLHVLGLKGGR